MTEKYTPRRVRQPRLHSILFLLLCSFSAHAESWRGLEVRAESRCAPYTSEDYRYSQSVEHRIIQNLGGQIYGPYTGTYFSSERETDIEHIVARSEAHDSGLCKATAMTKRAFANDLLNLTLASPSVNRHQKVDKDAAQWLPQLNKCWFVSRVIQVRRKYNLSIDRREADAIDNVLRECESLEMEFVSTTTASHVQTINAPNPARINLSPNSVLEKYDDDGNGMITCAEARKHGIAPVARDHPAYQFMNDRDGDGVVCE